MAQKDPTPVHRDPAELGMRIRLTRRAKGMRLRELAEKANCSESMISKIENGHTDPSLHLLEELAHALGITTASLFSERGFGGPVSRKGERPTLSVQRAKGLSPIEIECVTPAHDHSLLQANIHIIPPDAATQRQIRHEGEEFGYVLQGQLELRIGKDRYQLREGDSFFFFSDQPHGYRNPGETEARVLWANTPPTF